MHDLMDIDPTKLVMHVVIVSLSTLGIVEWLKNFIKPKQRKMYAVLGLFILAICATAQISLNPTQVSWFNLFTLGCAMLQFGHTTLIKIPEVLLGKVVGVKSGEKV